MIGFDVLPDDSISDNSIYDMTVVNRMVIDYSEKFRNSGHAITFYRAVSPLLALLNTEGKFPFRISITPGK